MLRRIIRLGAAGALALTLAVNSWAQQTWMINFKDSDIQELIKFVADATGRTVVIDPEDLEAALRHLRKNGADVRIREASDMALAKAILAL